MSGTKLSKNLLQMKVSDQTHVIKSSIVYVVLYRSTNPNLKCDYVEKSYIIAHKHVLGLKHRQR